MKNLTIIAFCLVLLLPGELPAENDRHDDDIVKQLRSAGIDETEASTIAKALLDAQETERIDPIVKLINDDNEAGFAAAALLGITDAGGQLLVQALKDGKIDAPEVMIHAFLFTKEKRVIDYLVERLHTEEYLAVRQTIVSVLRVLCSQDIEENGKAWRKWWKKNREAFEFPEEIDLDERGKAVQI